MDFEKLSDRLKGFIQSAQTLAVREGNPQITPEHLLKVLLDDPEGLAAGLIARAGGNAKQALETTEAALAKLPKVSGGGATQPHMAAALARVLDQAEQMAQKAGDCFVTVERALQAFAMSKEAESSKILTDSGLTPQNLNAAINDLRKGRTAESAGAEQAYDALKRYTRDFTEAAAKGKLDPVIGRDEEIRRTIQVLSRRTKNNPVLIGEPGVGKTAIVEGLAHRIVQGRRAGEPQGQEGARARSRRADRRRQISRRVRGAAQIRAQRDRGGARARSFCSSTRCTPWSAPARPTARWTPPTC